MHQVCTYKAPQSSHCEVPLHRSPSCSTMDQELRQPVVQNGGTAAQDTASGDEAPKLELTVDEIIEKHVGSLGFSQLVHVFLVSLSWMFDAQHTLVTVFSDAQPAWRCTAAAVAAAGTSSLCHRSAKAAATMCGLDRGAWEWVGGTKTSTISEWGLVCDKKFSAGVPASLFFLGSLFGSAVQGRLADSYLGRRKAIFISCVLTSVTAYLTSLSPNIWVYAFMRFCNGFSRAGIGICCLVLSTEAVGRKWRGQVGQYGFFFFTIGFLSLPLIAYPTRTSWRTLYKVISIPPLVYSLLVIPFVSESSRWLAVKGRTADAMKVLNKFAKSNGKRLPANLTIANAADSNDNGAAGATSNLWSVKWAARRMATLMVAGFGVGFVYYGLQLNVENLNFNLYFAVAMNALMEIPAVFLGSVFLSLLNRRVLFSSSACIAGVASILCILFSKKTKTPKAGNWAQLTLEGLGFMSASMAFDVIYVYSVELFPTNVRNFAVSMLRQSLMLGATIAPLLVVLGRLSPAMSFLVFGMFSVLSGTVTLWLPETKDAPLYETLEQQEMEEKSGSRQTSETEHDVELSQ